MEHEIWKDILGFEGLYQVSNLGNVKSFQKGKIRLLNPFPNQNGYKQVLLTKNGIGKPFTVQKLVAHTFILNLKDRTELNHINGIKSDNRVNNLEWSTRSENLKHAFKMGLIDNIGINNPSAKLNEFQVRVIKRCDDLSGAELGKIFGIDETQIYSIRVKRTWKHIA